MLKTWERALERIAAVEQALGIGLIGLIVAAITAQVFTRYVLGRPIAWVEESATYAFIWMVFIGASIGLKRSRHIVIATFGSRLPPRAAAAVRALVWLLVIATLAVLIVQGYKVFGVESRSKTISLPIELPRGWFYSLPLTVAAASMTLTTLFLLAQDLSIALRRSPRGEPAYAGRP